MADYTRGQARDHARAHLRGIWCAALMPFLPDPTGNGHGAMDEDGFRANLRHWFGPPGTAPGSGLGIDGVFVSGKQGEFFAMSLAERKRSFTIAAEEARAAGRRTILSCSDQNLQTVLELARHAEACGGDYIVVHAPVLHFVRHRDEILWEYYRHISERTRLGIAMWSHEDSGYLMPPALCARIAALPNIVAIKYSVPRPMYAELTRLVGDRLIVSTASEEEWLDNVLELGWRTYLCSSPPYLLQTPGDTRMRDYTALAFAGQAEEARAVWRSLQPVRRALAAVKPADKPTAHGKYWQSLLGQVGGAVRFPMLELTEAERAAMRDAFAGCGLHITAEAA